MAEYTLHITSLSPLLTHNPASMAAPKAVGTRGSNIPLPEVEAEAATYRLSDGQCAIPAIALRSAIIQAAGAWKAAGRRSSMKSVLAHIEVLDELLPLWNPDDGSPLTSYAIDRRRVRVQRAGVMRARPRFERWGTSIVLGFDEMLLTQPDILREIANDAGRRFGVGDYRPGSGGWFGKFYTIDTTIWPESLPLAAE